MPDFVEVLAVKQRAKARLLAIPGVHAVGIGHKWSAGKVTAEPSIIVLVETKRPLVEIPAGQVIPPEIDGIKTDVYESDVPIRHVDSALHRPLTGGIQIEGGHPLGEGGTLGCIAHTTATPSKVVALTCHHVVASFHEATPTGLTIEQDAGPPSTLTITGTNTPGTLIVAGVSVVANGATDPQNVEVFYTTDALDDLISIAGNLAGLITNQASPGLTASRNSNVITLSVATNFSLNSFFGLAAGPHPVDIASGIRATVTLDTVTLNDNTIALTGTATADGFASVVVNFGGQEPTQGFLVMIADGDSANDVAKAIDQKLNDPLVIKGVTTSLKGNEITVTGAEEIEVDIHRDRRVGQPEAAFCRPISLCWDRSIGTVIDASIDLDVALVQLTAGMQYQATIADIGHVTGTYDILPGDTGSLHVVTRGRTTDHMSRGTVVAIHLDGHSGGTTPPEFYRHYTNGISISGDTGAFSAPGDSGSAIVVIRDDPSDPGKELHEVAGIVFAGTDTLSFATPIASITAGLNVAIETAANDTDVQTVPAAATPAPAHSSFLRARLEDAERRVASLPQGAQVVEAFRRHADEAHRLVNSNRRVATVWHRNEGPEILQRAIEAAISDGGTLPQKIRGKPVLDCLNKIQRILMRYGSSAFAADLARLGPAIAELATLALGPDFAAPAAGRE